MGRNGPNPFKAGTADYPLFERILIGNKIYMIQNKEKKKMKGRVGSIEKAAEKNDNFRQV